VRGRRWHAAGPPVADAVIEARLSSPLPGARALRPTAGHAPRGPPAPAAACPPAPPAATGPGPQGPGPAGDRGGGDHRLPETYAAPSRGEGLVVHREVLLVRQAPHPKDTRSLLPSSPLPRPGHPQPSPLGGGTGRHRRQPVRTAPAPGPPGSAHREGGLARWPRRRSLLPLARARAGQASAPGGAWLPAPGGRRCVRPRPAPRLCLVIAWRRSPRGDPLRRWGLARGTLPVPAVSMRAGSRVSWGTADPPGAGAPHKPGGLALPR
jgi:hypothetical protein